MIHTFSISAISIFLFMIVFYLMAQSVKNNSIVDIGWGLGFVITTLVLIFNTEKIYPSILILSLMILFWGMRLSFYIYIRNVGKPEDFRYANWRKEWGTRQPWIAFYKVFMLQGFIMLIVASPVILAFSKHSQYADGPAIAGLAIFLFGLGFEGSADSQMKRFKLNSANKGQLITTGLWKYSRHPNYFGEALLWWGIGLYAFAVSGYWYCFVSPLVMSLMLRFVSGVPMLEEKYKDRTDFKEYAAKTSVFVPFIGRKSI